MLFVIHFFILIANCNGNTLPNIIFILADDLGFNDVGFHGSNQIPTPNIDALAYSGIILNNYYVNPICTPSRSALMTGKLPIHTGMQHTVLYGAEPRGLPLTEKILPEYLKEFNYVNRIVGKWHLGSYRKEYTPTYRGFDSHLGCWTGHIDYNDHTAVEKPGWGLDMRRNLDVAIDLHGKYVTDLYTVESVRLIHNHNKTRPLFLYLSHNAVHSGNSYNFLAAPDDVVAKFDSIPNYNRRRFAGMLTKLDESVGKVVKALEENGMLQNSIIIFSTDNGGPAEGFNYNAASNYPLRGVKNTLWEGGVRGAGLIWSPLLKSRKRVSNQLMHIVDWLPTIYELIGGDLNNLKNPDGYSLWSELSENLESKRDQILHNIDDIYGNAAYMEKGWKIVKGTTYEGQWDNWYGPAGREGDYNYTLIKESFAYKSLDKFNYNANLTQVEVMRKNATVNCDRNETVNCNPLEKACLFNVYEDPCEYLNLADKYPDKMKNLLNTLDKFNKTAVPPGNQPLDLRGDPKYWNYIWTNFGDYI